MFASFNFSEFAAIFAVYAVAVVISQIFLPQLVVLMSKASVRNLNFGAVLSLTSLGAWIASIVVFGWEAVAVFIIGSITEVIIGYVRRKTIVAAAIKGFEDATAPLNFNDIDSKAL